MERASRKRTVKILFLAALILFGLTLACLLICELSPKQKLGLILTLASILLSATSFGILLRSYKKSG